MVLGIYGASGLGLEVDRLARSIISEDSTNSKWTDIIFVDDNREKAGTTFANHLVFGYQDAIRMYGKDGIEFCIAIGEPSTRERIFNKLLADDCEVATLINPYFEDFLNEVEAGKGLICYGGSQISPGVSLGNNVLVQWSSVIGHNARIGDNTVISTFSFVGGDTVIGRNSYVAPNSCIRNGIHIGDNTIIGMGAVVLRDVPDNAVMLGNPARRIRDNESGSVFE